MRMDYETWCDCVMPANRVARCQAAEAKRARKAAKRRRDAELTRLGHEARGAWVMLATHWRRYHERGRMWLLKRTSLLTEMRAIRRGEVAS